MPGVDVVDGRAVRLVQGRAGSETEYGSALDAALGWQRDGADWMPQKQLEETIDLSGAGDELQEPMQVDENVAPQGAVKVKPEHGTA